MREATVTARGITEASTRVEVRARTNGIIIEQPFEQGDAVKAGDVLCNLDMGPRRSSTQAEAAVASAERDFEPPQKLAHGFAPTEPARGRARRRSTRRSRTRADRMGHREMTESKAPVAGVLVEKPAEAGSLLAPGGLCATIGAGSHAGDGAGERAYVTYVREGMTAKAKLATGERSRARSASSASRADVATRTFQVELDVANPEQSIREGVTAEIFVPLPPVPAHMLPAIVVLPQRRRPLRRARDASRRHDEVHARHHDRAGDATASWVAGFPPRPRSITVGQDYVKRWREGGSRAEVAEAEP